jgi:hypothetical protein
MYNIADKLSYAYKYQAAEDTTLADPHWFQMHILIRIQHFRPMRIRIQGSDDQKMEKN